jgi:uncharacterized protein YjbJ (UPF0337 family)
MNWKSIEGDWERIKADLQDRWDKLTADDLEAIDGQRARLAGRLRELYGLTEERAEAELRDWERHHEPVVPGGSANSVN